MRVVIFFNKEDRELRNFLYFESQIKEKYPNAEILITSLFASGILDTLLAFQPQVIFGYPLTARGLAKHYYLLKALFNCKIVLYRTEGVITKSGGDTAFHLGYENYGPQLVDGELFWGQKHLSVVAPLLLENKKLSSLDRVKTAGYLRYEALLWDPPQLPKEVERQIASYPRDKIVTFITGFQFAEYSEEDMVRGGDLFDPVADGAQEALAALCLARDRLLTYRERWIEAIIKTARSNPERLIVVKPHPVELELWRDGVPNPYFVAFGSIGNILFINEPCSTESLIARSAALVHYGSTCVAETYLLGTYSIEATAEDLMSDLRGNKYVISYGSLSWPSNTIVPVQDVAEFITKEALHCSGTLPGIQELLEDNFNLASPSTYRPSRTLIDSIFCNDEFPRQSISRSSLDLHYLYRNLFPMRGTLFRAGMTAIFRVFSRREWRKMANLVYGGVQLFLLICKGFRVRK